MRFGEILARLEQQQFVRRWRRLSERGIVPPPPESDLSYPPSTSSTNNRFANGYVDATHSEWVVFTDGTNGSFAISLNDSAVVRVAKEPFIRWPTTPNGDLYIEPGASGHQIVFCGEIPGLLTVGTTWQVDSSSGRFTYIDGVACVGTGAPAQRGIDDRTNVGSTDGSPKTVYAVPSGTTNKGFRLTARIYGFGGTVTSGVYEIVWTEGGVTVTKDLSITAVDTDADLTIGIQPDASTNVTAQLKTLTGTNPKVNVLCLVEGVGTGT
jgi:hypothetical protein